MWEEIGEEIFSFVCNFLRAGRLPKSVNVIWVALIPTIVDPLELIGYSPISIVGSLYMIVAKLLSNGVKGVMNYVISEAKFAFVQDRQILDGLLIANESIECLKS